jgi:16S rRNA (cytidine1402-2'-O)-methyltransferase
MVNRSDGAREERIEDALFDMAALPRQELPAPALYVVATPIGNAADITLRALWVLRHVDAIAAEDTRATRPLLARFGIATPLFAAHQHNEASAAADIVARLQTGVRIALVTDAGSPAISDPGAAIVRAVRAAGFRVVPIPGASSLTAAASVAGLRASRLHFVGFLPPAKAARARLLAEAARAPDAALAVFEAPHRIAATASEIAAAFDPQRRVIVAREITKRFEAIDEVGAGDLPAWLEHAEARGEGRGEYVLIVDAPEAGAASDAETLEEIDPVTRNWLEVLAAEMKPARAAALAARASGLSRDLLYRALLQGRPTAEE